MTLLFTDIHFGLKLNSELFMKIAQDNVKWIESLVEKHKITNVIFCGDWFHQRSSVSVNTLNKAYESLKSLASKVSNIYMIVGNHDSFYKNTISVHSLKSFEQIDNVHVIEKIINLKLGKSKIALVPWGPDLNELVDKCSDCDAMFGHFEPGGVKVQNKMMESELYSIDDLNDVSSLVFSGHYHSRNELKTRSGNLVFIGSPSQQNWGDCYEERGVYLFNENTREYSFVENDIAPKFVKFLYSDLLNSDKKVKASNVENNFIKIIVDCKYKFEDIQKFINKFNKLNPLTVEVEYFYSEQLGAIISNGSSTDSIKTHEDYIKSFIMDEQLEFPDSIDREKLLSIALAVYKKAQEPDEK